MKNSNLLTLALFILSIVVYTTVQAQEAPKMINLEELEMTSVDGKMILTWKTSWEHEADYFLVEKLDENWDYIEVGEVDVKGNNSVNTYTIHDKKAFEGENYYRITLIKKSGQNLLTDLLIADHFSKPSDTEFEILFNNRFDSYALNTIKYEPTEVGYFGDNKFAKNSLKVRRMKGTAIASMDEDFTPSISVMIASLDN